MQIAFGCPRFRSVVTNAALATLLGFLAGCGDDAAQQEAAAAAKAQSEAAAAALLTSVDSSVAEGRPDLARAFAEDLLTRYPASSAATTLAPRIADLRAAADAELELRRLRGLWVYHDVADTESDGRVLTAFIYATPVPGTEPTVRLVLRRHASWGQSAYLLITEGDFACQGTCSMQLVADGGEPVAMAISRAEGNVPPAVFIDSDAQFIERLTAAKRLELTLPLAPSRMTRLTFEVAGFDLARIGPEVAGSVPGANKR